MQSTGSIGYSGSSRASRANSVEWIQSTFQLFRFQFFTPRRDPTSPYRRKRLLAFWAARLGFFSNFETELTFPDFEVGFVTFGVVLEV